MNNQVEAIKKQIGENIKEIRLQKKIEIKKICAELDISTAGYSNIERGITDISFSRIIQLSDNFGVHFSKILSIDNIINYYFNQASGGGPQNNGEFKNEVSEGFLLALQQVKAENEYLKTQNTKLIERICGSL